MGGNTKVPCPKLPASPARAQEAFVQDVHHPKLSRKLEAVYFPHISSGIKALTNRLSSSICSDVARSLDEDFDSSHSSAAVGLSFLSSRGEYGRFGSDVSASMMILFVG
jgi:hypothetical protein